MRVGNFVPTHPGCEFSTLRTVFSDTLHPFLDVYICLFFCIGVYFRVFSCIRACLLLLNHNNFKKKKAIPPRLPHAIRPAIYL